MRVDASALAVLELAAAEAAQVVRVDALSLNAIPLPCGPYDVWRLTIDLGGAS